jgi:hypothetical protein
MRTVFGDKEIIVVNSQAFIQAIKHMQPNHCSRTKLMKLKLSLNSETSYISIYPFNSIIIHLRFVYLLFLFRISKNQNNAFIIRLISYIFAVGYTTKWTIYHYYLSFRSA